MKTRVEIQKFTIEYEEGAYQVTLFGHVNDIPAQFAGEGKTVAKAFKDALSDASVVLA